MDSPQPHAQVALYKMPIGIEERAIGELDCDVLLFLNVYALRC